MRLSWSLVVSLRLCLGSLAIPIPKEFSLFTLDLTNGIFVPLLVQVRKSSAPQTGALARRAQRLHQMNRVSEPQLPRRGRQTRSVTPERGLSEPHSAGIAAASAASARSSSSVSSAASRKAGAAGTAGSPTSPRNNTLHLSLKHPSHIVLPVYDGPASSPAKR